MKQFLLFFIAVFSFVGAFSQNRNKVWYFGEYAGIDFNTTPPTVSSNSNMNTEEGCASMCDNNNGSLLFYSNGTSVWNRNHLVMPNGTGLVGGTSSSQAALILPKPGSNSIYYIFTAPETDIVIRSMSYSVVDMALNNGLGDVAIKNFILYSNVSESITATAKADGTGYLIVVKELGTDAFITYSLNATGVNINPVISHAGIPAALHEAGCAKISPNGSKLCVAYGNSQTCQLFDFDNNTGIVSNALDLSRTGFYPYGVEFSPDNSKLYTTGFDPTLAIAYIILIQHDLAAGSPAAIQSSAIDIVHTNLGLPPVPTGYLSTLTLGPDDKIYIAHTEYSSIAAVNQPNLAGIACNYVAQSIILASGTTCVHGLPNNIHYPFTAPCQPVSNVSNSATICSNATYQLPSGTIVNTTGIYEDTIRTVHGYCDSIITTVNLYVFPVDHQQVEVILCPGQTYTLPSGIIVSAIGTYMDTIRTLNGSCDSIITTINLTALPVNFIETGAFICSGQSYTLPSGIIVSNAGFYFDTLRNAAGCDSIISFITLFDFPVSYLNTEAHICSNETYHLPSGTIVHNAGVYSDTLSSIGSCDSIINTIHLFVNDASNTDIVDSISAGQTYILPTGETVSAPGVYQSVLLNSIGCDSVITITLKLKEQITECITLRNAITPNGDGINDYWVLYRYNCFKRLEVDVYNRYGSPVYHSDDYKNDWCGKYKNKELPDGTYYYVIKVISFDGHEHVFKDNVTILR